MVFSLARIGAALGMKVEDVYTQNRRLWVRLREKGGKAHTMPCHHSLEECLHAYIDGAGLASDPKGPLFRTIGPGTDRLTATTMTQADAHAMIRRGAAAAGIELSVPLLPDPHLPKTISNRMCSAINRTAVTLRLISSICV
jgi:integrase